MRLHLLERWKVWRKRRHLQKLLVLQGARLRSLERSMETIGDSLSWVQKAFEEQNAAIAEQLASAQLQAQSIAVENDALSKSVQMYERTLEELRSKLHVAEDISIPSLVAANKLALERYNADVAVQLKRQMEGK